MNSTKSIAFFDFDGTITSQDSAWAILLFAKGKVRVVLGILWLSPILFLNRFGLMDSQRAKEKVMAHFFKGQSKEELYSLGSEFLTTLASLQREKAMEKISWHKEQQHDVVVVSASFEFWLHAWCENQGLQLLCTKLEYSDGIFSGRFDGPNCNGQEKAKRIKEAYDLGVYESIFVYGDTEGDRAMLDLSTESFFKPFRE